MTETRTIAGCPVFIDGQGPQTLVMIHGWPDTHRIWSHQVAFFRERYRCVTFSLPGFDSMDEGHSLDQIIGSIAAVVDGVSPDAPVILMIHDWVACLAMNTCAAIRSASRGWWRSISAIPTRAPSSVNCR